MRLAGSVGAPARLGGLGYFYLVLVLVKFSLPRIDTAEPVNGKMRGEMGLVRDGPCCAAGTMTILRGTTETGSVWTWA